MFEPVSKSASSLTLMLTKHTFRIGSDEDREAPRNGRGRRFIPNAAHGKWRNNDALRQRVHSKQRSRYRSCMVESDLVSATAIRSGNDVERYRTARVPDLLEFLGIHSSEYCSI